METEDPRLALSAVLRPVTPGIIKRIVDEATRSSGARADEVRAYEALLLELTPTVLDAIAANDEQRARILSDLAIRQAEGKLPVPPVPPVARAGLMEIGARLGFEAVSAAVAGRPDAMAIMGELEILTQQLRAATQLSIRTERQQPR